MSGSEQAPATSANDLRDAIALRIALGYQDEAKYYLDEADQAMSVVQPELDQLRETTQGQKAWAEKLDREQRAALGVDRPGWTVAELIALLVKERDEARTDLERHQVLASFFTGDGSQPNYPGTPSFKAWIDTSQELAETQREMDALRGRAVVLPEDWENRISDVLEDCDLLAVADWMTARKIVTGLLASWRPSA